jgi:hypothetical protein
LRKKQGASVRTFGTIFNSLSLSEKFPGRRMMSPSLAKTYYLSIPSFISQLLPYYFLFCYKILTKQVTAMKTKPILSFLFIILSITACNTTEPPPPPDGEKPTLTLRLEDVSCTEAWIELTTTNLQLPATVTLKQFNPTGDTLSQVSILNTKDSLLYIDSLLPNQIYQYQVSSIQQQVSSNELNVTTLDTTSHDFTFETWTFGTIGSSTLYDVVIINENNIWAVGEMYVADTSQNGYTMYNAVHWDGIQWELKRIYYYGSCSAVEYPPLKAIWAFSDTNIIVTNGGSIGWFNGTTVNLDCRMNSLLTGAINKIWGSSSSDLYVVGNNGNIVHYNGVQWTRIESGTDLNINDIWGDYNEKTGEWEVLAVASNYGSSWEKEILLVKNNQVQKLSTDSSPSMEPLLTNWFISNSQYYVAGSGIYQKRILPDSLWKNNLFSITTFATTSIRGNDVNDVFGVGAFGDFVHFNGIGWKNNYQEPLLSNGSYTKISVKGDLIVAVGGNQISINSEAVVLIGRR